MAIVGPTGLGKTRLVNLMMRFYELDAGRITLDGVGVTSVPRRELRSRLGMVLQDTWLFGGTIRDNIAYGRPSATEDEILEAARATYVDRFVRSLPEGYDTVLEDEGSNVSAGEKQLLTIARAFLARPSVLILDEATSSVDTRTEVLVQKAMRALRSDRTLCCIGLGHGCRHLENSDRSCRCRLGLGGQYLAGRTQFICRLLHDHESKRWARDLKYTTYLDLVEQFETSFRLMRTFHRIGQAVKRPRRQLSRV